MIVIADSGSTKCDWVVLNKAGEQAVVTNTSGFNPYYKDSAEIESTLRGNTDLSEICLQVEEVHFYGAGCSSEKLIRIVENGLKSFFTKATLSVNHDVYGSALSTYSGKPGISCILGTGSNSCYFDGKTIDNGIPSLGYILNDEGSGNAIGKKLITNYAYGKLPAELGTDFEAYFKTDLGTILTNIYQKPYANTYIASFAPFASKHRAHPFIQTLISRGFEDFLNVHVLSFSNAHQVPIHFVGSVAFYFKEELEQACKDLNLQLGNVIQKPIDGLIEFHRSQNKG